MTFDPKATRGAVSDLSALIAAKQAAATPSPAVGTPAPSGNLQPGETVGGATGAPAGMSKTLVSTVAGAINDLSGQKLVDLQSVTQPDPTARRDAIVAPSASVQPGETVGSGDGSMVTATPSASGTGAMIAGAGTRDV